VLEELWRDAGLTRLPHETLMVWGREDRVLPLDSAFVLLKQIPRARLWVLPQCGHWAQWEHAEEFNATVAQFLAA
jgi:4,5:9,10-diseco-3-hydroxy-5,9,17-trioxoandrosta-1(10),2-diene-4-oate hydrolase